MGGLDKEVTHSWLENGVKYVRIVWCDGSGQRRCRMVPVSKFRSDETFGVGAPKCLMAMPSYMDCIAPDSGLTATGGMYLVPDLSTGHVLRPQPGHALVLGDMYEKPGISWELCPRGTLRRLEKILKAEFGLELRAGFEVEFYLLRQLLDNYRKYEVVDCTPYCSTSGLNKSLPVVETMLSWLESMDVAVDQFHVEGGPGQFECVLSYDNALKSADKLLFAREGITAAAISHQLVATFLPKVPVEGAAFGSGNHVHLSIWNAEGKNVLGAGASSDSNHGLSDLGKNFFAGVLHHLPALMAIIASHPNSYQRILPNTWSGAFQCWGIENKEAALRAVLDFNTGAVNNFELKTFDGCSNPYIGLAAILAAGLDGLRKKLQLPDPVDENPADLAEGKVARLPSNLNDAAENLKNDEVLKDLLGHKLVTAILAIRQADLAYFSKNPIECTFPLEPNMVPLLYKY